MYIYAYMFSLEVRQCVWLLQCVALFVFLIGVCFSGAAVCCSVFVIYMCIYIYIHKHTHYRRTYEDEFEIEEAR